MPGHLKCLRSVNIFAHKALWWWPRLLWHGSGRLCKHSQFNLPLQNAECVSIGAVRYLFKTFKGPCHTWVPGTAGERQLRRSVSEQRALPGPSLLCRSRRAAFDVKWNIMSGETSISSYHCGCKRQSHWASEDSPQNKGMVLLTSLGMCGLKPNTVLLSGSPLIDSIYNSRKLVLQSPSVKEASFLYLVLHFFILPFDIWHSPALIKITL